VAAQGVALVLYHPCYLSHYGLLVGGLPGAARLGFEISYWGDAVTESLLKAVGEEGKPSAAVFGPNLAPFQAPFVTVCSPTLARRKVNVVGWEGGRKGIEAGCRYGIFYHRRADLDGIPDELLNSKVVAERRILGVWTARVVEFPSPVGQGEVKHLIAPPTAIPPGPTSPTPPPASPSTDRLPGLELKR
jgi:hypothetical protein